MEMRLNRAVAMLSDLSRRRADEAVQAGKVRVNGAIVRDPATTVDPDRDRIQLQGRLLARKTEFQYFALNKPVGVLSTARDERGRPTVLDLVPKLPGLFPVGRLDMDTRGLILITDDGDFAQAVAHPSRGVLKHYQVELSRDLTDEELAAIAEGRIRGGGRTGAERFRRHGPRQYEIILREGVKRQIRNIFATISVTVQDLRRTAVGPLRLGRLPEGGYRPLFRQEIDRLLRAASGR